MIGKKKGSKTPLPLPKKGRKSFVKVKQICWLLCASILHALGLYSLTLSLNFRSGLKKTRTLIGTVPSCSSKNLLSVLGLIALCLKFRLRTLANIGPALSQVKGNGK